MKNLNQRFLITLNVKDVEKAINEIDFNFGENFVIDFKNNNIATIGIYTYNSNDNFLRKAYSDMLNKKNIYILKTELINL